MIDSQGSYLLSDLGISHSLQKSMTKSMAANRETVAMPDKEQTGSQPSAYKPPELFDENFEARKPCIANDIFSLGVTLYELASGTLPFGELGGILLLQGVKTPNIPKQFSKGLNNLIKNCLLKDPKKRITAKELKERTESFLKSGKWKRTLVKKSVLYLLGIASVLCMSSLILWYTYW